MKKRNLREEAKIFNSKPFAKSMNEKLIFNQMIEIVSKAGNLLSSVGALGRPVDNMKILEMSMNNNDILLDKSRMLIMKLEKIFVIVPFTIAKIEIRTRNLIINMRPKFEAIQRFAELYLELYAT